MIDCSTATVQDLQYALEKAKTTSVEIVEHCLAQIEAHNTNLHHLNSILSVPSFAKATAIAAVLDSERRNGITRSPLHGIPIIVKDNILTSFDLGMDTTAGSIHLVGAKSSRNATIVQRLLDAGMIVLGKANLTEFAGLKTMTTTTADATDRSAIGRQICSPFVERDLDHDTEATSQISLDEASSGSAVSVAAGFAPLALGTETTGSVTMSAGETGVYAFRAGFGAVPMHGILELSPDFDMIGAFGRCTRDLAELASYLLDRPELLVFRPGVSWGERALSVAFVDPRDSEFDSSINESAEVESYERQQIEAYEFAIEKLRATDMEVNYPVKLPDMNKICYREENGEEYDISTISSHQLQLQISGFLSAFDNIDTSISKIPCLSNSSSSSSSSSTKRGHGEDLPASTISKTTSHIKSAARSTLASILSVHKSDLLAFPSSNKPLTALASLSGYSAGAVPFPLPSFSPSSPSSSSTATPAPTKPSGLTLVANSPKSQGEIFRFMGTWEKLVCGNSNSSSGSSSSGGGGRDKASGRERPVPGWVRREREAKVQREEAKEKEKKKRERGLDEGKRGGDVGTRTRTGRTRVDSFEV